MAPKKKKKTKVSKKKEDVERDAENEAELHRELDNLTKTLSILKMRAEQLRRENQVLQNDIKQIPIESEELTSYMLKQIHKLQNEITQSDQSQQKLEVLNKQREEMVEKHNEQVNALKEEILEKENKLALQDLEIAKLMEDKRLQQQYLDHIAELEQEMISAYSRHSETLDAMKANNFIEKERHKASWKQRERDLTLKAKKEMSTLLSDMQEVPKKYYNLRKELQQLIQKAHDLRSHQQLLQMKRRQLLLEKKYAQELQCLTTSTAQVDCFQLTDPGTVKKKPHFN